MDAIIIELKNATINFLHNFGSFVLINVDLLILNRMNTKNVAINIALKICVYPRINIIIKY